MANDGQRFGAMSHAASVSASDGVLAELPGDGDHVGVLQEHQPAVAVVVGERAERLGAQRDLRMQLERRSSSSVSAVTLAADQ